MDRDVSRITAYHHSCAFSGAIRDKVVEDLMAENKRLTAQVVENKRICGGLQHAAALLVPRCVHSEGIRIHALLINGTPFALGGFVFEGFPSHTYSPGQVNLAPLTRPLFREIDTRGAMGFFWGRREVMSDEEARENRSVWEKEELAAAAKEMRRGEPVELIRLGHGSKGPIFHQVSLEAGSEERLIDKAMYRSDSCDWASGYDVSLEISMEKFSNGRVALSAWVAYTDLTDSEDDLSDDDADDDLSDGDEDDLSDDDADDDLSEGDLTRGRKKRRVA